MAQLGGHPNIVTIFDIGEEDGTLFLVSQYMSGGDLAGLLAQAEGRRLAIEEVVRIGSDVARALEHAHEHGVVHRDIKPQNIWLAPDGTAKLGDFGLAMAAGRTRVTGEGMMVGTVAYMPPEQGLGRAADARSDLYSLGAVVYEMICGAPPFVGEDATTVVAQHVSTAAVAPSWHRPDVPRALERLVLKLLAKTPAARLQNATEVREALEVIDSASAVVEPQQDQAEALDRLAEGAFIGRELEVRELRSVLDEALAGRGRVFMITGEAGMGKTRLAAEIETYANLRGAHILWGRCYEGEGVPPYWPWVQVIRAYAQNRDPEELQTELGSGASDIAQVVSELRHRLPDLPEPQPLDPEQAQFRLFDSITTFLRNISSTRALVIVLEDLHLADRPSLLLLQFLARELASSRMFVLCTYRDGELDEHHLLTEVHASLSHERNYGRLRLRGLSKPEVKALLEELSRQPMETADELALLDAVYQESGGNPYFIEEILRHLVESGAIYRREGRWGSDAKHIDELGIPRGIRDVIDRRLARVTDDCRELLGTAAVIGHEFSHQILASVGGTDAASVLDHLRRAVDVAVLISSEDPGRYRFANVAMRDALYEALPEARRVELHRAIGDALEELYGDRVESHLAELSHHFAQAAPTGVGEKAAEYAWWAGERAAALAAYDEAVTHYQRALALFDALSDEPVRRCELLLALGDVRWRAGDVEKAKQNVMSAAKLAERLSLADQYARAALGYGGSLGGGFLSVTDRADDHLVALLRTALEALPERDSVLMVRVMARLAVELYYTQDRVEPDRLSRAAVEMAERLGEPRILLQARYSREWAIIGPDNPQRALSAADEIVRLAHVIDDHEMEFQGHHLRINRLLQLGDLQQVDREIRACERLAKELRQPAYEWQVAVFRTMRALMLGRFKEGERLAQTAFGIGQRSHPEVTTVVFGAHAFITGYAAGTLAELEEGGEQFAARYPDTAWPAALTWLLSEVDANAKARARFDVLAKDGFSTIRRDANWLTAMACLSMTCSYLEDATAADLLYDLLAPFADHCTPILAGAACLGSNHTFLGCLAFACNRLDDAIEHFEHALEVNARVGALLIIPRVYYEYARAVIARDLPGDRARARDLIAAGLEKAHELGTAREVERLLSLKLEDQGISDVQVMTSIDAVARSVEQDRPDLSTAAAPDGTVTILFSDIEESTSLTERLGDQRWLALLQRHNRIVRGCLSKHSGYEVKSQGDGFMVAFASARKAIRCSIEIQRALALDRIVHSDEPMRVRIGLHTGETMRSGEDFFGRNVILAARIAQAARGDQILVSSLLRELVDSSGEFEFGDERTLELKGLSGQYRVFDVPWEQAPQPASSPA
jgi:class 3 adenylate cyclase